MLTCFATDAGSLATPIHLISQKTHEEWLAKQNEFTRNWVATSNMRWEPGCYLLIPNSDGKVGRVVCCIAHEKDYWSVGNLPMVLPAGIYRFEHLSEDTRFAIVWGLGAYQFSRYKKANREPCKLFLADSTIQNIVVNIVSSICWVRDMINTPTEDMGPTELAHEAVLLARDYSAKISQTIGLDLARHNYNCIYTVGRASDDAPRLVDVRWGRKSDPKVTLVGKGVCFDSGGLDIKPASGMALMKKDMSGAAHVLGLARMIMHAKLPINLRVLLPIAENVISGNAYRPGDIIKSRKGLTVEIGNTDAEGRLLLADALAEAVTERPDLLIDIATLTGAARVAVGTELSTLFTNRDDLATNLTQCGEEEFDPMWRLPLYAPYREYLNTPFADLNNSSNEPYAGAITAALFLQEFVPTDIPWIHFDMMAWNLRSRPGRPVGGEACALRALFGYLRARFK